MITKQQLSKIKDWYYPYICTHEVMVMSGWKLYIFGEDINDSYDVCSLILPIVKRYNITMKIATQNIIERNTNKVLAWSIAVIYLHADIFKEDKVKRLLDDIKLTLKEYPKTGSITGAKSIDGKIHYRYDLTKPIEAKEGIMYDEYVKFYRGEYGDFNIPHNSDIQEYLNV